MSPKGGRSIRSHASDPTSVNVMPLQPYPTRGRPAAPHTGPCSGGGAVHSWLMAPSGGAIESSGGRHSPPNPGRAPLQSNRSRPVGAVHRGGARGQGSQCHWRSGNHSVHTRSVGRGIDTFVSPSYLSIGGQPVDSIWKQADTIANKGNSWEKTYHKLSTAYYAKTTTSLIGAVDKTRIIQSTTGRKR